MAVPIVGLVARWLIVGFAASLGWKLGSYVIDKVNEDDWLGADSSDTLKDLKHTWTGRPDLGSDKGAE